jgi:preprotein translocase subunit SecD
VRKRIRGRVILLMVLTLVTGYYIIPSIGAVGSLPSLFPGVLPRAERVNLGLDLQGGMHLVLEVQADRAVENAVERMMEEVRRLLEKEKIGVTRLSREGRMSCG